jgi:hypothetical protein
MDSIPEVDHISAFLILLVGSAIAAVVIYVFDTTLYPSLQKAGL